ncbi:MAG: discoidin domain-containing protein [Acidobacteria bacterium]|nr:discoidin domain-containing protein [Acidobacteriota bacterium]
MMIKKSALIFALAWTMALTPLAAQQDPGKEVLQLQLPKPMFIGTPMNMKSPNIEKVTGKPRGPFYVPKGTVLLSLNRPVTSRDMMPVIGELSMITDGEKEGGDGYFVELGPGTQWIQIDLGAPTALHAILVWHYHSRAQVYRDVIVQASDDADFLKGVQTVFNNDHDNTAGLGIGKDKEYIETSEGRLFDPKGIRGRYLRFYSGGSTSNDMNHYIEVEIYGQPIQ